MERGHIAGAHVGRHLAEEGDQAALQRRRLLEAPRRPALHAPVDEGGQHRVVAGDPQSLQVVQGVADALGGQARRAHQLVGGDALVRVRFDQRLRDGQQLAAVAVGDVRPFKPGPRLLHRAHSQRGREDLHPVLLAGEQHGLLQPRDRGPHAGVVRGGVPFEGLLVVLSEDLSRRGLDLAVQALLLVHVAQRPQHAVDLTPREPGAGRHAELALHVVLRVEQDATRPLLVPSSAARLLEIVLQRAGDVGVDDQANVRLVDAHAEGVGGDDGPQVAADEALLDVLLRLRGQPRVEVVRIHALGLQERRQLLAVAPRGAVDDRPARLIRRQVGLQYLVDVGGLLPRARPHHDELQIGTLSSAVEDLEVDAQLLPEVVDDLGLHVGFGGRREAEDRRDWPIPRLLADEAPHVPVVGPEVVPPLREAVCLVQHPAADLPLVQGAPEGDVAELLGRRDDDANVSQPHPIQRIGALGHGQQPVDGDAGADASGFESRHLVGHERDQRRNHHGQGAGLVVAGERRQLVAERLARAGGQDAEHVLPGHGRLDDGPLQGLPVLILRLRAEVGEAEPPGELLAGVVPLAAPATGGVGACGVAQSLDQPTRLGELMPHPGRHNRAAPRHRQPRQRIGKRPAVSGGIRDDLLGVRPAGVAVQLRLHGGAGLGVGWSRGAAQGREDLVESCPIY